MGGEEPRDGVAADEASDLREMGERGVGVDAQAEARRGDGLCLGERGPEGDSPSGEGSSPSSSCCMVVLPATVSLRMDAGFVARVAEREQDPLTVATASDWRRDFSRLGAWSRIGRDAADDVVAELDLPRFMFLSAGGARGRWRSKSAPATVVVPRSSATPRCPCVCASRRTETGSPSTRIWLSRETREESGT